MSVFENIRSLFGKKEAVVPAKISVQPYKEEIANIEYNKLFCDIPVLFRPEGKPEGVWQKIFAREAVIEDLKAVSEEEKLETRTRILAFNALRNRSVINDKEVLGVVIEVGTEEGNEAIGLYKDLRARYINAKGRLFAWDNTASDVGITDKIEAILMVSQKIIGKAEPWTEPRQAPPAVEGFRISFLVADGFYVGEGQLSEIAGDAAAKALIFEAGDIMVALVNKARPAEPAKSTEPAAPDNTPADTRV